MMNIKRRAEGWRFGSQAWYLCALKAASSGAAISLASTLVLASSASAATATATGGGSSVNEARRSPRQTMHVSARSADMLRSVNDGVSRCEHGMLVSSVEV